MPTWREADVERLHELRNGDNLDWPSIAILLNRTVSACKNRYEGKNPWRQVDRQRLFALVKECTVEGGVDWNAVVDHFPDKTVKECKLQRRLGEKRNTRFTEEERGAAREFSAKECFARFGTHTFNSWKTLKKRV